MVLFAKRIGIPGEIALPPPFARIRRHFGVCAAANHAAVHEKRDHSGGFVRGPKKYRGRFVDGLHSPRNCRIENL
ncbi:hypothetical protein EOA22_25635 [Mesorhizobium sp. M7A.F.Ca.US.014.04.1.1]|nr:MULTISPECIES: hypothetical protein [Mesorhizobium]RUX56289.1 hypothetical protein EOA22_25635 [Mesorhizobium sp. M7A.F.Ca.US.014.04.1.1]RUY81713.1 hypothetical protein EN969_29985 [Mesorhizobium sp. M7A.F.Ca.CA.003.01.2.1]RVB49314.1 hypothetical protein ENZ67_11200 [Mesorhizobium sp. M7A.F.Ca.CA.002.03.1.1]MDF3209845.1 hypothetical protein [Mesorhizobium sp. LMG15046]MDF3232204.1 hypothetical protein [Mesorhizobium sp. DSM 30133]